MQIHFSPDQPEDGDSMLPLQRRGFQLGYVAASGRASMPAAGAVITAWRQDQAMLLPAMVDVAPFSGQIAQAHRLMEQVLENEEAASFFDEEPYCSRLQQLPLLGASLEEHDRQGIEKIYFDAEVDGEVVAEGLWCKASWLSFHDEDASLRFRFSFGMEGFEDVAADPVSQHWAGELCDALFPESAAVTADEHILQLLHGVLDGEPAFVERIVYFNAPNGGAQMHHDVERGHDGVIYAQLSGSTFWLALAKPLLMDELVAFVADPRHAEDLRAVLPEEADRQELARLLQDRAALSAYLDEPDHELVEAVMDRCAAFVGYLVERGYGYMLEPGDALLLPQRDLDTCVWHSVYCLGDEPGEALSFALRRKVN
ncbi:hypothetical protein FE236_04340 [Mariprofundus erugo]|nr:hypothetical protein FE236_04340 [Mariprofundus erugo]